ncbi:glutathione synthase [Ferrimonas lipolytica]|uniref:glutathione synthase n=1 Tax=Ferrimonas lipolytica TaxID=2724191 RepID=A0A6H1UII0_9GAMM|nr:glutathione synthase [Ferrimonas lipolytica]QIZ78123.1 glutathione synthase [Ferrimonas lipolytica]
MTIISTTQASSLAIEQQLIDDASEWALMHGVGIKNRDGSARHCPYSLAPVSFPRATFERLQRTTPLLGKLIHALSEDHHYLQQSLNSMGKADPFFARLLELHRQIHDGKVAPRQPLLIMRTDYMDDRSHGAQVIEFNGIAAGMGPFGQLAHQLHKYIQDQWPEAYQQWGDQPQARLAENHGLEQMARGIATTARKVRNDALDHGQPVFVMVVQEQEDNVYDQHLLAVALQQHGVRTIRRTFAQLADQLSSGPNQRLLLDGVGGVDVVYLRAGYQYIDYYLEHRSETRCCHTLSQTRVFIEQHKVALNATVSQQLATSKTMQMLVTAMSATEMARWGITETEAKQIKAVLAQMKPITPANIAWLAEHGNADEWVLKNQGEGGGHAVFGDDIFTKLASLNESEYDAWALMRRLYPHERERPALTVRDNQPAVVENLISEIGLFTLHFRGEAITDHGGYAGYLIRSKPASENEGGIHSGRGVLDSLVLV